MQVCGAVHEVGVAVASTTRTVSAVMTPSPIPIGMCTPTIARVAVIKEIPVVPPTAYSNVKASDARTTEQPPAIPGHDHHAGVVFGKSARSPR